MISLLIDTNEKCEKLKFVMDCVGQRGKSKRLRGEDWGGGAGVGKMAPPKFDFHT